MMFQNVFRFFLVIVGLALLLVGLSLFQSRQLIGAALVALIGLGLLALPFTSVFKEAVELD